MKEPKFKATDKVIWIGSDKPGNTLRGHVVAMRCGITPLEDFWEYLFYHQLPSQDPEYYLAKKVPESSPSTRFSTSGFRYLLSRP